MTKEDWLRQRQDFDRTLYTVRQLRKPIFAAVNGIAYGGGCELAQSTDFIIASENATFGQPEAMLGLAAGGGSPALLPRLLPPGKALQMLMTGDPITAQEAHRLGMVNELHPQDELLDAARRIAEKIASNSPTAVQAVKRAVQPRRRPADRAGDRDHDGHALAVRRPSRPHRGHRRVQRRPRADLPGRRLLMRAPSTTATGGPAMAVADELARARAALQMINPAPYNAEAPPEALDGEITPTDLHYVRSNFALPDARRHARDRRRRRAPDHADARRPARPAGARARGDAGMRRERPPARPGRCRSASRGGTTPCRPRAGPAPCCSDVLDLARPATDGVDVRFSGRRPRRLPPQAGPRGYDKDDLRFVRALPLGLAADPAAEILIAYEMNGEPLRADHGAPFRLIVPHWYAVASVKWLQRIDVLTEPFAGEFQTGHYMYEWPDRPHEPVTLMRVRARITSPRRARRSAAGHTPCAARPGRAPVR